MRKWIYMPHEDGMSGTLCLEDATGVRELADLKSHGPGHVVETGHLIAGLLNRHEAEHLLVQAFVPREEQDAKANEYEDRRLNELLEGQGLLSVGAVAKKMGLPVHTVPASRPLEPADLSGNIFATNKPEDATGVKNKDHLVKGLPKVPSTRPLYMSIADMGIRPGANVVLIVDVSGSMFFEPNLDIRKIVTETVKKLQPEVVSVIQSDTATRGYDRYRGEGVKNIDNWGPWGKGGGGTDHREAIKRAINENPDAIIILGDDQFSKDDLPRTPCPLWLLDGGKAVRLQ